MSGLSSIEWTDATWNPTRGCTRVSDGCRNCYAERQAVRHAGPGRPYEGLAKSTAAGPRWTGEVRLVPELLDWPLRRHGDLEAIRAREGRNPRVFVNSMSDLFHERLTFEEIAAVFGVMAAAPGLTFQVLTKRPQRALEWFEWIRCSPVSLGGSANAGRGVRWHAWHYVDALKVYDPAQPWEWPLPNVQLGVSAENQATANERVPLLLECPAAVRFVSYEPALGPVSFDRGGWLRPTYYSCQQPDSPLVATVAKAAARRLGWAGLDWLIGGFESGPGARPGHLEWMRSARDECRAAGVPIFVKQLGPRPSVSLTDPWPRGYPAGSELEVGHLDERLVLRDRKGGDWSEWPDDLRVREFPATPPALEAVSA